MTAYRRPEEEFARGARELARRARNFAARAPSNSNLSAKVKRAINSPVLLLRGERATRIYRARLGVRFSRCKIYFSLSRDPRTVYEQSEET